MLEPPSPGHVHFTLEAADGLSLSTGAPASVAQDSQLMAHSTPAAAVAAAGASCGVTRVDAAYAMPGCSSATDMHAAAGPAASAAPSNKRAKGSSGAAVPATTAPITPTGTPRRKQASNRVTLAQRQAQLTSAFTKVCIWRSSQLSRLAHPPGMCCRP